MTPLLAALVLTSNLLVLRSGERIVLAGPPTESGDRITFRTTGGQLFTMPLDEVDLEATAAARKSPAPSASETGRASGKVSTPPVAVPLKVSEQERKRLLAELEGNHEGKDAAPLPPAPPARPEANDTGDEWSWRNRARAMDEAVRRAEETRDLLAARAEALRNRVASLLSLGYKPSQFTWDTTQLQQVTDQLPWAELEIRRAERARDDFRDEARRRGILPGWLR